MNQGPYNPYNAPAPYGPPSGAPGYPPQGYPPQGYDYEFSDAENAVISKASFWSRMLGIFTIITGVASLINCNVVAFAIDLAVGIAFLGAATSLNMVVATQGNDIQHMMTALGKLRSAFKIRVIVVIVAVVLVALLLGLAVLLLIGASASR